MLMLFSVSNLHVTVCAVTYSQRMLVFDGLSGVSRTIKLRPRQLSCAVCGDNPTITRLIDYEMFCGSRADDKSRMLSVLDPLQRITCQQYKTVVDSDCAHLLIDVREPVQYEICHLDNSTSKYISQYSIYVHSHDVIVMWVTSSHYAL